MFGISSPMNVDSMLAVFSVGLTSYFWLVKSRRERPSLQFYQLSNFRATLRRVDAETGTRRLCISQIDTGGVLAANNSTRQNSVIRFECFLKHDQQRIKGLWGWSGEDKPPWNIPPDSTIALSPACFFEVPENYEIPDDLAFHVNFVTVGGHRFGHGFTLQTPEL